MKSDALTLQHFSFHFSFTPRGSTKTPAAREGALPHRAAMEAPIGHDQNADQIAYWNGPGGQRWADRQQTQDILLAPVADLLVDRAQAKTGERVIDVGCGSGAISIAIARRVGPNGHVTGIDISAPMLARARWLLQR
jgi:tRNA A58 N-methylase Trm61